MKSYLYFILAFVGFGLVMFSCADDDTEDSPTMVTPRLDLQMRVGTQTLNAGDIYEFNGTALQVNVAQFYMGNLNFTGDQTIAQEDYYIVGTNQNSLTLPSIEAGSYGFEFGVGVTPEINSLEEEDFTTRPTGHALGMQNPSMHWSWNAGYKFLRIDGMVDTDADGVPDQPVEYHLGSNAFYSVLNAPEQVNLTAENNSIILRFDLEAFFNGVDLSTGAVTHVMDNKPMADQLLANYTTAFSIIF